MNENTKSYVVEKISLEEELSEDQKEAKKQAFMIGVSALYTIISATVIRSGMAVDSIIATSLGVIAASGGVHLVTTNIMGLIKTIRHKAGLVDKIKLESIDHIENPENLNVNETNIEGKVR